MRSTDEVYGSLAYDGASLLRFPFALAGLFCYRLKMLDYYSVKCLLKLIVVDSNA